MKIRLFQITNGFQHINRLEFTGDNNKKVYVDLWDNEIRELEEQINQFKILMQEV